jgi:hypothetical protein
LGTKHFGDPTHWGVWDRHGGSEGWSEPGWALPADPSRYISRNDPYWDRVLQQARRAYGDPDIHYSTDSTGEDRQLVFGDGTRLPQDGAIVYHDSVSRQNWAQNDDGTMSLVGADGTPGPALGPAGYRRIGDQYAPVNDRGQQIAPQLGGVPSSDNGFHTDPATGVLTPKNANGDYYTLGPDGRQSFFDKNGAPISKQQFDNAAAPREPGQPPAAAPPTDEQQSGKAAEAIKKLQQELKSHYSKICDAEEKLSEVLLNAHATTAAGRSQLNDIQTKIVDAVNNPTMATDTAAGERAFLTFLRNQVSAIHDLLASGSLSAEDQGRTAQALSALYAADTPAGSDAPAPPPGVPRPDPPAPAPNPDPGVFDPGPGPAPQLPDPSLSDLLGAGPMGMPAGADPLSSLASLLPAALGGLGAGGASPLDGLGGLLGAGSPLAGLPWQSGDHGGHDHPDTSDTADDAPEHAKDGKDAKTGSAKADTAVPPAGGQQPAGQPGQNPGTPDGPPPTAVVPAAAGSATVKLPDGSVATARTPQAAQAIRDYLAGDTVDASYRKNGIALPPPGTPITHPVDPSRLTCGDLAMFKDHYVPVLSAVKACLNGQVVPLGSVSSSPDFLGWIDPTAALTSAAPPAAPAPAEPPAQVPGG